jgi:hypothetical protein
MSTKTVIQIAFVAFILYYAKVRSDHDKTLSDEQRDLIAENMEPPDEGYDP